MFRKSKRLTMSKHRGHKQHEIEDMSDLVDHISNLPDCILDHILSFMPTKEVVKTSILSTRWKNLWAFVPNIDIDDELLHTEDVDDVSSFVNFVERVLGLRDASNMEKFRLSCHIFKDEFQIYSWISDAIMHNVKELDLNLYGVASYVIPRSMFKGTSLVSLKISLNCAIELPSHVSFPCLKTLHLSFVRFLHHHNKEKLFSRCPVLEELVLSDCKLMNLKNIAISISNLKSLTIRDVSRFGVFDDPTSGCKMKIDATNLRYFEYTGYLSDEIIFMNNTASLDTLIVDILNPLGKLNELEVGCRAIELLKRLQNVVSLRLSNHTLETLVFADNTRFPVFPNLTHLMLTTTIGANGTIRVLMDLLSCCPFLQSICFSEGFTFDVHLAENNSIWSKIPICISNSLKTVTLKDFHGYKSEICFLHCALKYACVLERMNIWWFKTRVPDLRKRIDVTVEIETLKRSSKACVIKFL